jgi:hypothetical protein
MLITSIVPEAYNFSPEAKGQGIPLNNKDLHCPDIQEGVSLGFIYLKIMKENAQFHVHQCTFLCAKFRH